MNTEYTDISASRRAPAAPEAEHALLGSILLDPEKIRDVTGAIRSDDFYLEKNREIYEAMQALFLQNRNIEPVTLIDELVKKGCFDEANGKNYIMLLADSVPSAANITDYAKIIRDKSMLRKLAEAGEEICDMAYEAKGNVDDIIDNAEQKIFNIASDVNTKAFTHIKEGIVENYNQLYERATNGGEAQGLPTYFKGIDELVVGLGKGDFVIIGARPGMGKTAFCLNIATNVALHKPGMAVAVFSLEMPTEQIVSRMLSSIAGVDSHKMRTGNLDDHDWDNLARAASSLSNTDILIDDSGAISVTAMKAKLRRVQNLGLVIIDYLQLMQSDEVQRANDSQATVIGKISRSLKLLAKDLRVPVIACAQLNRGVEGRNDKTPMSSDLRDSGAIEQDADLIMFLYREGYYEANSKKGDEKPVNQNVAQCIISKNRHGPTGKVNLGWYGQYSRFFSVDNTHDES